MLAAQGGTAHIRGGAGGETVLSAPGLRNATVSRETTAPSNRRAAAQSPPTRAESDAVIYCAPSHDHPAPPVGTGASPDPCVPSPTRPRCAKGSWWVVSARLTRLARNTTGHPHLSRTTTAIHSDRGDDVSRETSVPAHATTGRLTPREMPPSTSNPPVAWGGAGSRRAVPDRTTAATRAHSRER